MKKAIILYTAMIVLFTIAMMFPHSSNRYAAVCELPEPNQSLEDDQYYIDLNRATAKELEIIPGVGPKLAENIVAYRDEIGGFREYAELLNVNGIGIAKLETIMEYVRIL